MSTKRLNTLLAHYATSHQHPTNEKIHLWAIPLIVLSLCGLMLALTPWVLGIFLFASLIYYYRLSPRLCALMLAWCVFIVLLLWLVRPVLLPLSIAVFVVAWIFQFIGHRIEGKKPSFFEDVQYLWIGPVFVLSRLWPQFWSRLFP